MLDTFRCTKWPLCSIIFFSITVLHTYTSKDPCSPIQIAGGTLWARKARLDLPSFNPTPVCIVYLTHLQPGQVAVAESSLSSSREDYNLI